MKRIPNQGESVQYKGKRHYVYVCTGISRKDDKVHLTLVPYEHRLDNIAEHAIDLNLKPAKAQFEIVE